MRLLANECLHVEIVAALRQAGHEVATIAPADTGSSDEAVLERALRDRAILLTADKDFGEIAVGRAGASPAWYCFAARSQTQRARLPACWRSSRSTAIRCTTYTL